VPRPFRIGRRTPISASACNLRPPLICPARDRGGDARCGCGSCTPALPHPRDDLPRKPRYAAQNVVRDALDCVVTPRRKFRAYGMSATLGVAHAPPKGCSRCSPGGRVLRRFAIRAGHPGSCRRQAAGGATRLLYVSDKRSS